MPIIEGIGDDVMVVLLTLFSFGIISLAWLSTSVYTSRICVFLLDRQTYHGLLLRMTSEAYRSSSLLIDVLRGERPVATPTVTSTNEPASPADSEHRPVSGRNESTFSALSADPQDTSEDESNLMEQLVPKEGKRLSAIVAEVNLHEVAATPASTQPDNYEPVNQSLLEDRIAGSIKFKLKYLNEEQRDVIAHPEETLGQFKRREFSTELSSNQMVRMIFNGRELRPDENTLRNHNIVNDSVVHCMFVENQFASATHHMNIQNGFDIGRLVFPLFGFILFMLWYCRIMHRHFFSNISTISLFFLTIIFSFACMSSRLQVAPVHEVG